MRLGNSGAKFQEPLLIFALHRRDRRGPHNTHNFSFRLDIISAIKHNYIPLKIGYNSLLIHLDCMPHLFLLLLVMLKTPPAFALSRFLGTASTFASSSSNLERHVIHHLTTESTTLTDAIQVRKPSHRVSYRVSHPSLLSTNHHKPLTTRTVLPRRVRQTRVHSQAALGPR